MNDRKHWADGSEIQNLFIKKGRKRISQLKHNVLGQLVFVPVNFASLLE